MSLRLLQRLAQQRLQLRIRRHVRVQVRIVRRQRVVAFLRPQARRRVLHQAVIRQGSPLFRRQADLRQVRRLLGPRGGLHRPRGRFQKLVNGDVRQSGDEPLGGGRFGRGGAIPEKAGGAGGFGGE